MSLLSPDDERQIEAKIAEIEARSASEIVVAVLGRSAPYPQVWLGLVLAAGIPFAALVFLLHIPVLWTLLFALTLACLLYAARGTALTRLFIMRPDLDRAVRERAERLFVERGIDRTAHRTGVLLFVSEFERRVVILGDQTIHERLGDTGWQAHVEHIVTAIRRREAARGVVEVLDRLGNVLAELLPVEPGDRNELPNRVVREAE